MKTRFNLFAQKLFGPTHSEIVIPVSVQFNRYSKVHHKYEWMSVFSIKFLLWEFGFAITKLESVKNKKVKFINEELVNYSEEPYMSQSTSVPEKQIGDDKEI
jgi:hypothetical protein